MTHPLTCSAKGCRADAVHALQWRNPRLHDESRVKTWLACSAHVTHLGDFLRARSFPVEVVAVSSLGGDPA